MASLDLARILSLACMATLFVLPACGRFGGESSEPEAAVLSLDDPLEDEADLGAEVAAGAEEPEASAQPTRASAPLEQPEAQPASARAGMNGVKALDTWHRSLPASRVDVLDLCSGESASALADLQRAMNGEAKSYRASVRMEIPGSLGEEFARYAQAYADGDVEQLATALQPTPDPSPAWMVWTEALARMAVEQEEDRLGGAALGRLVRGMLNLGYSRDLVLELRPLAEGLGRRAAASMEYDTYAVESGEAMYNVRLKLRREGQKLNYRWISEFNGKGNYNLRVGEELKIPRQELHVEVWRGARVTAVFAGERPIRIYPCSVGRPGEETPLGNFTLEICETNPVYYGVTPAVPYGNPENPLGDRWMGFKEKTSYGIHGTNDESTIGTRETEGCVRMHNSDVRDLFDLVPVSTAVAIHG
ncbi:MAG: L,D-transpeptidase family protein [Planctomycetes bacterium]|nr:L,D-transpeptidase family protein [Planctomycetota bacterium]